MQLVWICLCTALVLGKVTCVARRAGEVAKKFGKPMNTYSRTASEDVRKMLNVLQKFLPNNTCKELLTKRQLTIFVRSACLRHWPIDGVVRLFNHDSNCSTEGLMKILNYAPWTWWDKLIHYSAKAAMVYKEMLDVTKYPHNKRFLTDYYFRFVNAYNIRCNINQIISICEYKKQSMHYWSVETFRPYISWMFKSICDGYSNPSAVFNSKVVLHYEESLRSHPVHVINLHKHCSPTISYPWTIPDVLLWLKNCTKLHHQDCSKNYCSMILMAVQLNCEPVPCFRNVMIMSSKYRQTQNELLIVFNDLVENKLVKSTLEKFYDDFEKSIIGNLLLTDQYKLDRLAKPKLFNDSAVYRVSSESMIESDDYDREMRSRNNDTNEQYPELGEISKPGRNKEGYLPQELMQKPKYLWKPSRRMINRGVNIWPI